MLKGSFSHLNPAGKLVLLVILVFGFLMFSLLVGIVALVPFYGTDVIRLISSPDFGNPSVVNALKVLQIFNATGGLLLPAILYLWLCRPAGSQSVFSLQSDIFTIVAAALLIIFAQPLVGFANELNSHLALPGWLSGIENWMKEKENLNGQITDAFLATTSKRGLLLNIFMIAILPAFAEELLFRGALAGLLKDWIKNMHLAVFISAFVFAAIHLQFYGFLPRFLLGIFLGYLFFWSGNIWLPVMAHFTNNFLSVLVEFLFRKGITHTNAENFAAGNAIGATIFSFIAVTAIMYVIYKRSVKTAG